MGWKRWARASLSCLRRSCGGSWVSGEKDGRFLAVSRPAVRAAATCWRKDQCVADLEYQIVVCGRFELDFETPLDHYEYVRLIGHKPIGIDLFAMLGDPDDFHAAAGEDRADLSERCRTDTGRLALEDPVEPRLGVACPGGPDGHTAAHYLSEPGGAGTPRNRSPVFAASPGSRRYVPNPIGNPALPCGSP